MTQNAVEATAFTSILTPMIFGFQLLFSYFITTFVADYPIGSS